MTTPATLTSGLIENRGGARLLTLDCPHGRTTMHIYPPASDPTAATRLEQDAARLMVLTHWLEEQCVCTAELRQRYGLARA